jgi:hypothetical protein
MTAIQTASSSRITSDDFRCRRSQFIIVVRYDQLASGIPYGNPSCRNHRRRPGIPRHHIVCCHIARQQVQCPHGLVVAGQEVFGEVNLAHWRDHRSSGPGRCRQPGLGGRPG